MLLAHALVLMRRRQCPWRLSGTLNGGANASGACMLCHVGCHPSWRMYFIPSLHKDHALDAIFSHKIIPYYHIFSNSTPFTFKFMCFNHVCIHSEAKYLCNIFRRCGSGIDSTLEHKYV